MKNLKFLIIAAFVALVSACQKDTITVNLKTDGTLSVEISDSTGKKYSNVKVHLLTYYSTGSSYSNELDTKTTNSNGVVNFGSIASGTYTIVTDTVKNGNKYYLPVKQTQILTASTKKVTINPFEYVGTLNVHVYINPTGVDTLKRNTLRVALVKYSDYNTTLNRAKVISKAVDIQTCSKNGDVQFKNVPANINYATYVYVNNSDTIGAWYVNGAYVYKDNVVNTSISINMSDIIVVKADLSLTVNYYSSSTFNYKPVANANVVLVYYNDYSNYNLYSADLSTIMAHKVTTGITNASGKLNLTSIPAKDYKVYVYYSSNTSLHTWYSSDIYLYAGSTNTYTAQVTGTELGLTK